MTCAGQVSGELRRGLVQAIDVQLEDAGSHGGVSAACGSVAQTARVGLYHPVLPHSRASPPRLVSALLRINMEVERGPLQDY